VSGDEVGHEVERDAPPDGAEDVAGHVPHPPEEAGRVVELGQVLEQERHQQHRHHRRRRPRADHRRDAHPGHHLRTFLWLTKSHTLFVHIEEFVKLAIGVALL
jgi:hypothetical protein